MSPHLDPTTLKTLLVRGTNWVGDSIMSVPALKKLRRMLPDTRICLLVLPWVSEIFDDIGVADEVLIYDRGGVHAGALGRLRLIRELRGRAFDGALLLQNAFEAALLTRLAGIPIRAGYARDARGWLLTHGLKIHPRVSRLHQAYYYLDLVDQALGIPREALDAEMVSEWKDFCRVPVPDTSLQVNPIRRASARRRLKEEGVDLERLLVGVHAGAAFGSAKRWPLERFAQVLDKLAQERGAQVLLFGAPNEISIARAIERQMRSPIAVLSGRTSLAELIALIDCCDLFITNDSGPMHLAAALRVPMLAIFGSTDEVATGPLSPTAKVINKKVECSPCLLRECPIDHRCMTRISVEEVYGEALPLLQGRREARLRDSMSQSRTDPGQRVE
ncbi:MAG: lipopolysaccharide heptosyltransferase II [Acidobacteriota bacterium]